MIKNKDGKLKRGKKLLRDYQSVLSDVPTGAVIRTCIWEKDGKCENAATKPPSKKPKWCLNHYRQYYREYRQEQQKAKGKYQPTVGAPLTDNGIEKRSELVLLGQADVKKVKNSKYYASRNKRETYEGLPEHIRFVIDTTALGYAATSIQKLLRDKYGETADQVLDIRTIASYQKRYIDYIETRRKELRAEIPIVSPVARLHYLQDVVNKGLEGIQKYTRTGQLYTDYDLGVVVQAVREMNSMQKTLDEQAKLSEAELRQMREIEDNKRVIKEYIAEQKQKYPEKTELEILKNVTSELQEDYEEALKQIEEEMRTAYAN